MKFDMPMLCSGTQKAKPMIINQIAIEFIYQKDNGESAF